MTSDRFRACLALLHWSQRGLAALLQCDERQVRRWAAGAAIPKRIAAWLERLAAFHASNPPPGANAGDGAGTGLPAATAAAAADAARVMAIMAEVPCRYCGAPTVFDDDGVPRQHYCTRPE